MIRFLASLAPGDAVVFGALTVLAQITVIIVLAAVFDRLVRRRGAATRHAVWLVALLCVLISPLSAVLPHLTGVSLVQVSWSQPQPSEPFSGLPQLPPSPEPWPPPASDLPPLPDSRPAPPSENRAEVEETLPSATVEPQPTAAELIPFWPAFMGGVCLVWAGGALVLLLRLLHGFYWLIHLRRTARPLDPGLIRRLEGQVVSRVGLLNLPPILTSAGVSSPAATGVIWPCVVLPEGLVGSLSEPQLSDVLTHEAAHIARRDPLVGLLQRFTSILFWPHPLIHFMSRQLARCREEACDDVVLRHGDACGYARTLLTLAERCRDHRAGPVGVGILSSCESLEDRVAGLLDRGRSPKARAGGWSFVAAAALLLTSGLFLAGIRIGAEPLPADEPPPGPNANAPDDPSTIRIDGVVVDETGRPVAGADVNAQAYYRAVTSTTLTDKDGRFHLNIDHPFPRLMTILASAKGGELQGIQTLDQEERVTRRTLSRRLVLRPAQTLTVRVVDGEGKAVPDAAVGVHGPWCRFTQARTDAAGTAVVRLPSRDNLSYVVALKPGVGCDYTEDLQTWPRKPPAEVKLVLNGARTVRVQALDAGGRPLEGVVLYPQFVVKEGRNDAFTFLFPRTLDHVAVRTDARGVAVFDWLPKDLASMPGRSKELGSVRFQPTPKEDYYLPQPLQFRQEQPDALVSGKVLRKETVSGKLTSPDDKPAAGILVYASGPGPDSDYGDWDMARTNAQGEYTLKLTPNLLYALGVIDDDWAAPDRPAFPVKEGEPLTGLDFRLSRGTLITGTFTAGPEAKPVPGQVIELKHSSAVPKDVPKDLRWVKPVLERHDFCDREGRFRFRVGPGNYGLFANALKDAVGSGPLVVQAEDQIEKNLKFPRPFVRYSGTVKTPDGKPVPEAWVTFISTWPGHLHQAGAFAGADGSFAVDDWQAEGRLYARSPDGRWARLLSFGEKDKEFKIELSEAATLKGRVVNARGQPFANHRISGRITTGREGDTPPAPRLETWTDAEGRFTFAGVPTGSQFQILFDSEQVAYEPKGFKVDKGGVIDLGDIAFP